MAQACSIIKANHDEKSHLSQVRMENVSARESVALDYNNGSRSEIITIDDPPAFDYRCRNERWNMKNRRIIELSDRETKMELHRKFELDEIDERDEIDEIEEMQEIGDTSLKTVQSRSILHNVIKISNTGCGNEDILLPKLPSGTILTRRNNCSNINVLSKNLTSPGVIGKTKNLKLETIKPVCSPEKINRNIKMRRNPARGTKKKYDDIFIRPRLLATKRRGNNIEHVNHVADKKQTKLSNVPYMNTRSVTKKLYNVGANHQSPTVEDEIEWKEWPIHGMHERPIYHSQVGVAVECLGNNFISLDGYSYQKVAQSSGIGITPMNAQSRQIATCKRGYKKSQYRSGLYIEDSFENCMHESLHSVLAYSAQITTPLYKKLINNYNNLSKKSTQVACSKDFDVNSEVESSKLETAKPPLNLKCIKNHAKLQRVLKRGSKNTLILLKTTDSSLQTEKNCKKITSGISSSTLIPVRVETEIDSEHIIFKETSSFNQLHLDNSIQHTRDAAENSTVKINNGTLMEAQSSTKSYEGNDLSSENWLQELLGDTAILYCTAIGIHQDDFVMYLNTLDSQQCINWIKSGY